MQPQWKGSDLARVVRRRAVNCCGMVHGRCTLQRPLGTTRMPARLWAGRQSDPWLGARFGGLAAKDRRSWLTCEFRSQPERDGRRPRALLCGCPSRTPNPAECSGIAAGPSNLPGASVTAIAAPRSLRGHSGRRSRPVGSPRCLPSSSFLAGVSEDWRVCWGNRDCGAARFGEEGSGLMLSFR
jgi:hypothetical protein